MTKLLFWEKLTAILLFNSDMMLMRVFIFLEATLKEMSSAILFSKSNLHSEENPISPWISMKFLLTVTKVQLPDVSFRQQLLEIHFTSSVANLNQEERMKSGNSIQQKTPGKFKQTTKSERVSLPFPLISKKYRRLEADPIWCMTNLQTA